MSVKNAKQPRWCIDTIDAFRGADGRQPERIALLTQRLARSGEILTPDIAAADVASTGGPASLSTFVSPLILASRGVKVPKIGVPGRPAGVIDTFGVLPGYKTNLSRAELEDALHYSNFGNTLSTGVFAPDDSVLFRARQVLGAQNVPALVVASLLSKKLAAGLTSVVFDVRTMRGGNFGQNPEEAQRNIDLLEDTAALIGITVHCAISNGEQPAQPMLGRTEALRGLLMLLNDDASPWLERHFESCVELADLAYTKYSRDAPHRINMRAVLDNHLRAQGAGGLSSLEDYLMKIECTHQKALMTASEAGTASWNMAGLRDAVVGNQNQTRGPNFADDCGVELLSKTGNIVSRNTPIATIRAATPEILARTAKRVASSIAITPL